MEVSQAPRGAQSYSAEIWNLPWFYEQEGELHEAFVLDAQGLLVHAFPRKGHPDTLIPYSCAAWAIDERQLSYFATILERKVHSALLSDGRYERLYKEGLPALPHLYANAVDVEADASLIASAISAHDETTGEIRIEIESELSRLGVYKITSAKGLSSDYLQYNGVNTANAEVVTPGWISAYQVIRKITLT